MTWLRLARLSITVICLGLSACVTVPETVATILPTRPADGRQLSELLERFERICGQSVDEQRRELAAAQAAFEREPNESSRLRLALALNLPQAPWRDDARVVSLLAEWITDPTPSLRRQAAQLVYRLTVERQRMVKDEQRRTEGIMQVELKRTEGMLHEERKKVEELQQKLDALREIDRNTLKPARR